MAKKKAAKKKAPATKKKAAPAKKKAKKAASPKAPAHGSLCHVDLSVSDLAEASKTYAKLFGWQFHPMHETENYFMAAPGGMPGGCMAQSPSAPALVYVNVDDIDETLEQAEALGARTVKPRTAIPGGHGSCATVRMPDGNVLGLYNSR